MTERKEPKWHVALAALAQPAVLRTLALLLVGALSAVLGPEAVDALSEAVKYGW